MKKIKYIRRKRALGDVLWIEPIIRQMAELNDLVIVNTKYNILFNNYPLPNVVFKHKLSIWEKFGFRLEKWLGSKRIFICLDNAYEKRPDIHFLQAYQKEAGLPEVQEYPLLYLSDEEKERKVKGRYIVLHLESFSNKPFRKIYGVDWDEICKRLSNQGISIIVIGVSPPEIKNTIREKTDLRQLMSLIYHCDLFIGLDSGPSHISSSLKKTGIIFFGAINPLTRHYPLLFKGKLIKKPCEYDNDHEIIFSQKSVICNLSDNSNVAKCCVYDTENIYNHIQELI